MPTTFGTHSCSVAVLVASRNSHSAAARGDHTKKHQQTRAKHSNTTHQVEQGPEGARADAWEARQGQEALKGLFYQPDVEGHGKDGVGEGDADGVDDEDEPRNRLAPRAPGGEVLGGEPDLVETTQKMNERRHVAGLSLDLEGQCLQKIEGR